MSSGSAKVVIQAIGGNFFITIIKFIGWFFSQSPSLLAEAVHSLADTFNQILLLIGYKHSLKEATRDYPTGHGSARYVWNLISAVGIFFIGFCVTFYHGMHSLFSEHSVGELSYISIAVLIISFIIEFWVLRGAFKEVNSAKGELGYIEYFKQSDDPTIIAVLLEDSVAVLGVSLAFVGVLLGQLTGSALFDIYVSLMISFLMAFMAIMLGVINSKLLLGKSLSIAQESEIKKFIQSFREVDKIIHLSTKINGAKNVRLTMEVEILGEMVVDPISFKADLARLTTKQNYEKILMESNARMVRLTGNLINKFEKDIRAKFPEIQTIDIEIN